ncbi:uncharacterized protein SPSK_01521 [Sporothrix schenckii 1099-18]|uniref:Heterokaryon incompatibility domain-containing protein n=1 Tax=Sporothrix schenckii 1099-18 TaxID=1397361 RepID=A0A0F2MCZ6_SPOSC|nr:uncharacterized protein SPSK_01521 [Sporothrix schenckii 1099-18]KJR87563.1 hypothetical protein SPSK_01521 [Sporothrix schenckii 1099-18]
MATPHHGHVDILHALYKPLREHQTDNEVREIRLLYIDEPLSSDGPEDEDDRQPLVCRLQTCTVADAQRSQFYALSYAWGDPLDTQPVLVHGRVVQATRSLVAALQHVPVVEPRCHRQGLWVDALCIIQADNHEKSAQVVMMKVIFSGAHETLAWLGPGDAQSRAALQLVRRIWADKVTMGGGGGGGGDGEGDRQNDNDNERLPQPQALAVPDVLALVDRLGGASLFTTDELILGRRCRLIAGHDACDRDAAFAVRDWVLHGSVAAFVEEKQVEAKNAETAARVERIRAFVAAIDATAGRSTHFHKQVVAFRFTRNRDDGPCSVVNTIAAPLRALACLRACMQRASWDPRDAIFGLCGMAYFGVAVDYDLSAHQLFCSVAAWLARSLGATDGGSRLYLLLSYAGLASRRSTCGLPSWVPDWSVWPVQRIIYTSKRMPVVPAAYVPGVTGDGTFALHLHGVRLGRLASAMSPGVFPGVTTSQAGEGGTTDTMSSRLALLASAAEFLSGMSADAIVDKLVAPTSRPSATAPPLAGESFVVSLVELLANPYRRPRYTYAAVDVVSLIHCLVASGRVALPASSAAEDAQNNPGDKTLSAVLDCDGANALDRDALLREAAYQFQQPTFESRFFGVEDIDRHAYVYFRTDSGLSGYAAAGVQPGDVVYKVAGCQDVVVVRPVGSRVRFLSLAGIVGFAGHYDVDWDTLRSKVEAVDIS